MAQWTLGGLANDCRRLTEARSTSISTSPLYALSFDAPNRPVAPYYYNFQKSWSNVAKQTSNMSHHVTVTRTTTTTTSSSAIFLNTGYLKSFPGLLKLFQLIIGAVCVGLVAYSYTNYYPQTAQTFFLLMSTTFMIGTFCLLLSCLISLSTSSIIAKTIYEVTYHFVAFGLYLAASITLLAFTQNARRHYNDYEHYMAASILGLIVSGLYLCSAILSVRHYRGL